MRRLMLIAGLLCGLLPGRSATLERLSMDQMIDQSTAIVRGRVTSSHAVSRGPVIYTVSRVEVLETWKGARNSSVEVAMPGGTAGGLRQSFPGVPELEPGAEYVLFLWTGKSGTTYVIGLSQGLFHVRVEANGDTVVERPATSGILLDAATGAQVQDQAVHLPLSSLRARVRAAVKKARQ